MPVEHQVLSNLAAGVRESMWKRWRLRQYQQPRRFSSVCAKHHCFRALKCFTTVCVVIYDAGDQSGFICVDLSDVAVRANLTTARLLGFPDHRRKRRGLGPHLATEVLAEAAMQPTAAAAIRL